MQKTQSASMLLITLISVNLVLAGCASLGGQGKHIPAKTYLIQIAEKAAAQQTADTACLTLVVNGMRAAPGFTTSRIAYMQKEYQLDYFSLHQWADTPANMLTTIIAHRLGGSHLFRAVVEPPAAITADLRLDSELLQLQQTFTDELSVVQLQLQVQLIDLHSRNIVASRTLSFSETSSENTPYGGVVAANRAVTRLMPELVSFIGKASHDLALSCRG